MEEFKDKLKQFLYDQVERSHMYICGRGVKNKPRKYIIFDIDDLKQFIKLIADEFDKRVNEG